MAENIALSWAGDGRHIVMDSNTGRWFEAEETDLSKAVLREKCGYVGTVQPLTSTPHCENLVIHGDNLLAMKALFPKYRENVDLVYIDPPFNTGRAKASFTDSLESGAWLSMFRDRALTAFELLKPGGVFTAHLNYLGQPYARVVLDELYGLDSLVSQISWQRAPDRTVLGQGLSPINDCLEYILVYAKGKLKGDLPPFSKEGPLSWKTFSTYSRVLKFSPSKEIVDGFTDKKGKPVTVFEHPWHDLQPVGLPGLRKAFDQPLRHLRPLFPNLVRLTNQQPESTFQQNLISRMPKRNVLYSADFTQAKGKYKGKRTRYYLNGQVVLFLSDVARLQSKGLMRVSDLNNLWTHEQIPATGIAREGGVTLKRGKKPELLLKTIIECFTKKGDLVLDYFAGTGTTGAVAHKLQRRFIMVEAGPKQLASCLDRMRRVVDGKDPTGITKQTGFKGGGGFRLLQVEGGPKPAL